MPPAFAFVSLSGELSRGNRVSPKRRNRMLAILRLGPGT
jgi:hypothetical protein